MNSSKVIGFAEYVGIASIFREWSIMTSEFRHNAIDGLNKQFLKPGFPILLSAVSSSAMNNLSLHERNSLCLLRSTIPT
jgi:hypothetical protein